MQLCSDDSTFNKIVPSAEGRLPHNRDGTFKIIVGTETEQTINVDYHLKSWDILEQVLLGNLAAAQRIQLKYEDCDIVCLELLQLETHDKSLHYEIIQVSY